MQEARDEEEREEQLMEVERASSQKISDRDHARHMNKTAKGAQAAAAQAQAQAQAGGGTQ